MIKINLLPYRDVLKKKNIFNHMFTAGVTLGCALLAVLVANILITSRISAVERETVRVEAEIASNKKIVEEIEKLKAEKELYRKQLEVIENLKKGTKGPVLLLDRLATSMPERTWLLSLKQKGQTLRLSARPWITGPYPSSCPISREANILKKWIWSQQK